MLQDLIPTYLSSSIFHHFPSTYFTVHQYTLLSILDQTSLCLQNLQSSFLPWHRHMFLKNFYSSFKTQHKDPNLFEAFPCLFRKSLSLSFTHRMPSQCILIIISQWSRYNYFFLRLSPHSLKTSPFCTILLGFYHSAGYRLDAQWMFDEWMSVCVYTYMYLFTYIHIYNTLNMKVNLIIFDLKYIYNLIHLWIS